VYIATIGLFSQIVPPNSSLLFGSTARTKQVSPNNSIGASLIDPNTELLFGKVFSRAIVDLNIVNARLVRVTKNSVANAAVTPYAAVSKSMANLGVGLPNGFVFYNIQAPANTLKILDAELVDLSGNVWKHIPKGSMSLTENNLILVQADLPNIIPSSYNNLLVTVQTLAGNKTLKKQIVINTLYTIFPTSVSIVNNLDMPPITTVFPVSLGVYSQKSVVFPVGPLVINPFVLSAANTLSSYIANKRELTKTIGAHTAHPLSLQSHLFSYTSILRDTSVSLGSALSKNRGEAMATVGSYLMRPSQASVSIGSQAVFGRYISASLTNANIVGSSTASLYMKGYIAVRNNPLRRLLTHTFAASLAKAPSSINIIYGMIQDLPGTRTIIQSLFGSTGKKEVFTSVLFTVLTNSTNEDYTVKAYKESVEYRLSLKANTETWIVGSLSVPFTPNGVTAKTGIYDVNTSDPDTANLLHMSETYVIPFKVVLIG